MNQIQTDRVTLFQVTSVDYDLLGVVMRRGDEGKVVRGVQHKALCKL